MPAADPFAMAGFGPAGWTPGAPVPSAPPSSAAPANDAPSSDGVTTVTVTAHRPADASTAKSPPIGAPASDATADPFAMAGFGPAGWVPPSASVAPPPTQQPASPPAQQPGFLANLAGGAGAALTGVAQGAVGGKTIDYAAAGLGTPWRMLTTGEGIGPAFNAQLAQEEAAEKQSAQQYPVETIGGELGGGFKTAAMLAPALAYRSAAGLLPKVGAAGSYLARNAAFGGLMAAANGQSPTEGAGIGAGIAAALPAAGAMMKPFQWVYGQLAPILSEGAQEASVGSNLARTTGVTPGQVQTSPVGPLDLAQATNNPSVAAKVRFAQGIAPDEAAALRGQQVQAVRDQLAQVAQPESQAEASQRLVNTIRGAGSAAKDDERALWNAPALKTTQVQTQWLKGTVAQAVKNLDPGLQLGITGPIKQALDQLGAMPAAASVSDLNSVRTALRLAGKPSEANPWASPVSRQLQDAFMEGLDRTLGASTVPDDVRTAYDAARSFTRQRAQAFGSQDLRALRGTNPDGAYTTDASEGARKFFNFSNASPEGPKNLGDLSAFVAGLKHQSAGTLSGEMKDAARSYVVASLAKAVKLGEDQAFNPNAMVRFLGQNRAWMATSGLFDKAQLDAFDRVLEYGRMLGRTENLRVAKNSATSEKGETTKTFIDQVMSPWLKRGLSVGGLLAGEHTGGVVGAALGGVAGHVATEMATHAEEAMRHLMAEAAFNPRVAQDLLMKASAGNEKFLSPKTAQLLERLRITSENVAAQNQ